MMILEHGMPNNESARAAREQRTYRLLAQLGIEYDRVDHASADTMEDCREIERTLGAPICKNLFLCNRQETAFYLLMMPSDKPFRTKELSAQIGSARLSFASPEKMEAYLDILPGAVSVLGLMNDRDRRVQLLIDEDLLREKWIGCHPCVNTSSLRLCTETLLSVFLPAVGHGYRTVRLTGGDGIV